MLRKKKKKVDQKDMEPREVRTETPHERRGQGYDERIKTRKEKLDRPMWHSIFVFFFVLATSLDQFFFYIPTINDQKKCLEMDEKLKKTVIVVRSLMVIIYILHIIFQIVYVYLAYASESREKSWKSVIWMINSWIIIIDVLCLLPIPELVILVYFPNNGSKLLNWRHFLNLILIFQFVPRVFLIYYSCKILNKNVRPREIADATWVKGIFIFFLYTIASHIVGAMWYFFSVHRELACWQYACKGNSTCNRSTFLCKHQSDIVDDPVVGYLNLSCPLITPSRFDFGMFLPALQSGIVNSNDFPRKVCYCFAWGLRSLSSFGSNLETSAYFWENLFSAAITVAGLLLFIYLLGNLQTYLQFSAQDYEKSRMEMEKKKEREIDAWIRSNEIPKEMRKELNDCARHLREHEEVNLKNLFNLLPTQSKKCIKKHMCLPILRRVPRLETRNDKFIEIIIDHLKPVIFNEHMEIFKKGEPLSHMLFFTHGLTWAHETATNTLVELKRGDFYGEELLEWALTPTSLQASTSQAHLSQSPPSQAPSSSQSAPSQARSSQAIASQFPVSHKTVKTETKVEAFALELGVLKKIIPELQTQPGDTKKTTLFGCFSPHHSIYIR